MRKQIVHHVSVIGDSKYTDCGVTCTNGMVGITQNGRFNCKRCIKISKKPKCYFCKLPLTKKEENEGDCCNECWKNDTIKELKEAEGDKPE